MNFNKKQLETIQYNATLAITRAITRLFKEKHYQDLGFEPHAGFENYVYFTKFIKINVCVTYNNYYPKAAVVTKQSSPIIYLFSVLNLFKNTFFRSSAMKWNKLDS